MTGERIGAGNARMGIFPGGTGNAKEIKSFWSMIQEGHASEIFYNAGHRKIHGPGLR
jgi:hypothetical protein